MRILIFLCLSISFGSFAQRVGNQSVIESWKETAEDKNLSSEERTGAYLSIIHNAKNQPDTVVIDAYRQLSRLARSEYD